MYRIARRLEVPGCARIQPISSFSSIETKNIRCASSRCEIDITEMRGLPSSVYSKFLALSGVPVIQASKPGAANRLLSAIASEKRSFAGKNESRFMTPTLVIGGFWISLINAGTSRLRRSCHALSSRREIRMCSRLDTGSASMFSSVRMPVAVACTRSRYRSTSSISACAGASKECSTDTGNPELLPGV